MSTISIDQQISKIIKEIDAMPSQINMALIPTLNRTAEWMKGRATRGVAAEKRIKLKIIRDRITIMRASKTNMQAALDCNFKGILARDLGRIQQTKAGAKAGGILFKGAFRATLRPGWREGIYRRTTKKRFPVKSVYVPIIDEARNILEGLIDAEAQHFFEKRFLHEIKRVTGAI